MGLNRFLPLIVGLVLGGCASSGPEKDTEVTAEQTQELEPETPRFVVVSRLSPLYLQPSVSAPSIVYRTDDEQRAQLEQLEDERTRRAERVAKRLEKAAERERKRAKRVKKRIRRLRGERRQRYREKEEERAIRKAREKAEAEIEREIDWVRDHPGEAEHEHLFAAELVNERGDWVGIRPLPPEVPRCYHGAVPALERLDVILWVKRSALYDVVRRRTRVSVAQGTEVILAKGIAVEPGGSGVRKAYVDGFVLGLSIPDEELGMSYETGRGFDAPYTETVFRPEAFTDDLLRLSKDAPLPFNPWHTLHVTATLYVGNRFYATTQTPCAEFTVRTIEEALEPVGERGAMRLGGGSTADVSPPMFVAGAELFTPDGEPIGKARGPLPVLDEFDQAPDGMRCWSYSVWPGDEGVRQLPICAANEDFESLNLTNGL